MRKFASLGGAFARSFDEPLANRFEGGTLCSAFDGKNFNPGANSKGGIKLGMYSEPDVAGDTIATILGSGYFNAQADNIDTGDFMLIYSARATGGGAVLIQLVNTAGVITEGLTIALA